MEFIEISVSRENAIKFVNNMDSLGFMSKEDTSNAKMKTVHFFERHPVSNADVAAEQYAVVKKSNSTKIRLRPEMPSDFDLKLNVLVKVKIPEARKFLENMAKQGYEVCKDSKDDANFEDYYFKINGETCIHYSVFIMEEAEDGPVALIGIRPFGINRLAF